MSQFNATAGSTVTAFFDDRDDAEDAVDRLIDAGVPRDSIRLVPGHEGGSQVTGQQQHEHRGFFDSLADFFFPDQDRHTYAEGLRRGGYLVTVSNLSGATRDTAIDILDDEGAIDLDQREQSWRSEGWAPGTTAGATGMSAGTSSSYGQQSTGTSYGQSPTTGYGASSSEIGSTGGSLDTGSYREGSLGRDEDVIPVVEEQLRIGKRDVNLGRVRVRSYVHETPVSEDVNLHEERVYVERRPVDRALGASEADFQDRVLEAEEHAEEAVVSKQARVVEEIGLRKETENRTETVTDTVRHTEVEIEDDRTTEQNNTYNNRR